MTGEGTVWIEVRQGPNDDVDLWCSDVVRPEQRLTVEVGSFDGVVVVDGQMSNACGTEVSEDRASEPTRSNHEYPCFSKTFLSLRSNLRENDLTAVSGYAILIRLCGAVGHVSDRLREGSTDGRY